MMKPYISRGAIAGLFVLAVTLLGLAPAKAQVARITAVQAKAEKRSGDGPWGEAPVGTELRTGDRVRTGKRSKVDLKFPDGSLIRLGQLSQLEIRGAKETQLNEGKLLFSFLKPGRILAGSGAAEIKGTVGVVSIDDEGRATFALYSGLMDVTTQLRTVALQPGKLVSVATGGGISRFGNAAPLEYSDGTRNPELLSEPQKGPFIGSNRQLELRQSEQQRSLDPIVQQVTNQVTQGGGGTVVDPNNGGDDSTRPSPFPTPFPTPTDDPVPDPFPTVSPDGFRIAGARTANSTATLQRFAAAPDTRTTNPAATGSIPTGAPSADEHLADADWNVGSTVGSDVRLLGAFADEGAYAVGGRLHGFAAKGHWFVDAAVVPLRTRRENAGGGHTFVNQTNITDLSATYTSKALDFQIGRQRYLDGPTQATLFGSMIRAGGREIMDSIKVSPKLSDDDRLEISYVYDSFVRDLPYRISGPQKAWIGRYERKMSWANFGLNALKYQNTNFNDTVGLTVDFGIPVIKDQLELYGEVGRDPFRRRLTSVGAYLPGVYQKTGFDIYIEWAKLKDSSEAAGAPNELAARVYKKINRYADALLTVSRFNSGQRTFILGVSIGDPIEH